MDFKTLVLETKTLCKQENEINAQIIKNLVIISNNKIHLQMGYGSLFTFCVEELKLSPASTQRKLDAVKLSEIMPEIATSIESGEISLGKISQVSKFIREEKKYADRELTKTEIVNLVSEVKEKKTDFEVQKVLALKSHQVFKPIQEKTKVMAGGRQTLEIEVDDEFFDLFKQIQQMSSHEGFQTKSQLIKKVMKFYLSKKHPEHKKHIPAGSCSASNNPRYISQKVKSEVWTKNKGSCSFTDPISKKRCGSTFRLQYDHIFPVSMGGKADESNLRLLCQAHNLFNADKMGLLNKFKQSEMLI